MQQMDPATTKLIKDLDAKLTDEEKAELAKLQWDIERKRMAAEKAMLVYRERVIELQETHEVYG